MKQRRFFSYDGKMYYSANSRNPHREVAGMFATTPALASQSGALLITAAKHSRLRLDCGQIPYQAGRTDDESLKKGREQGGRKELFLVRKSVAFFAFGKFAAKKKAKIRGTTTIAATQLDRKFARKLSAL